MRRRRKLVQLAALLGLVTGAIVVADRVIAVSPTRSTAQFATRTPRTTKAKPTTRRTTTKKATSSMSNSTPAPVGPFTGHVFGPPRAASATASTPAPAAALAPSPSPSPLPSPSPSPSVATTTNAPPPTTIINGATWIQTFADDFTTGLGPAWTAVTTGGGVLDDTFGSECYQSGQVNVTPDGVLTLTGIERATSCNGKSRPYASGMVTTRNKFSQRYGRFEARMKMPEVRGSWPAWWLMPSESFYGVWPRSGEIDIVEYVADAPSTVFHTIHWSEGDGPKIQDASASQVTGTANDWHTYAIEWAPGEIRWFVDDVPVKTFHPPSGGPPFDRAFYLILNQAVGGEWPGPPVPGFDNTVSVDWVRVYRRA